ncbi:type I-E CRISPR-associated protein Cas7/Cse4/CasC [Thorsellia anophelis]|uniref:CRISPR system Cascade subunit CasC n=1 Tax=Thorsellia anophelis DSM 18579 TaxID=1123402 RepID=A0A1I0C2D2_9GAMM|nr:type I-E CRISPR-associated protein Cas7/Cse4/CasC [Thorsellia anophelis]SET13576.1 CRISPR system Cascade subunit CasC [Thorsellia anophelis DSM 18579]
MLLKNNLRIEYHILQSFPVSCLNRDDVGAPKTAIIGGVNRARVSSQAWKRQVRMAMQELGIRLGMRTKKIFEILHPILISEGANEEQAQLCADKIANLLGNDTLIFISESEARAFIDYAKKLNFNSDDFKDKELAKVAKKALTPSIDALDIALFGRMVAKATDMNVEAAASFSHAISTHKVSNEVEFFTALDDLSTTQGSAHMGSLEFNSATYYRYISLDLGQLAQSFGDIEDTAEQIKLAIEAFTKALFIALPSARQATQSAASPWEFAKVLVRTGQRIQVPFETAIKSNNEGFLSPSIQSLKDYISLKEKLSGSLFGKLGDYEWGEDETFSIDDLIKILQSHVE